MSGLGSGLVNLFKGWGRGIGNAADNLLLGADARKAISDEVINKFKPMIERAKRYESKRATNIKDLDAKLNQSKQDLADAQKAWQDKYNSELASAKSQRQTDIANYDTQSKAYQDALDKANASRQSIFDKLYDDEDNYDRFRTIFTDVNTGERFILNHITGQRESLTKAYKHATPKQIQYLNKALQGYGDRLYDSKSGKVINVFDESNINTYQGKNNIFDSYYSNKISTHNGDIRNANNQIKQANDELTNWKTNNSQPQAWNDAVDLKPFRSTYEKTNGKLPKEYSFNDQNYKSKSDLDKAYKEALAHEQSRKDLADEVASRYASKRDAEIAQRIQDAKDINKAKLALGAGVGAGALYAGARAMYGGDDTPDTPDNTDNTDNTNTGEPDPDFKIENTPEGKAALNGKSLVDSGFDPDKADAIATLAAAAHDTGVEAGNSIESSDDHFIDDDELYGLLKAMKDPYKADAVANYIYSKHGNESDVQNLGWRGWLNKYYGDLLRSRMNIDPSGYKGMHISGGL